LFAQRSLLNITPSESLDYQIVNTQGLQPADFQQNLN